jgi:hypothetical protein
MVSFLPFQVERPAFRAAGSLNGPAGNRIDRAAGGVLRPRRSDRRCRHLDDSGPTGRGDGNDNVERWQISESTIAYDSSLDGTTFTTTYRADIVTYVNGSLNGGDTALTTGRTTTANPGFAVLPIHRAVNASRHR